MDDVKLSRKDSDQKLLLQLRAGSVKAYEELYVHYKDRLQSFCILLLKSPTVAQDIIQEVFIKIWQLHKELDTDLSFSNYVYTLAKNMCLNEIRSAKRKEVYENMMSLYPVGSKEDDNADTRLILEEYQRLLKTAIEQLPEQKRNIFILSRDKGLSHKEIAELLRLSPHTVQSHISDSLRMISNYFMRNADMELYSIFIIFLTLE